MSSSECEVLNSRGWTDSLAHTDSKEADLLASDVPISSDLKSNKNDVQHNGLESQNSNEKLENSFNTDGTVNGGHLLESDQSHCMKNGMMNSVSSISSEQPDSPSDAGPIKVSEDENDPPTIVLPDAGTFSKVSTLSRSDASSTSGSKRGSANSRRSMASPAAVNRVPLVRQSEDKRAKRCRFYRNGDRWFPGAILAVSSDKHRSWDALLADVTRLLEHPQHLASGVRYIFSLEGNKIEGIQALTDRGHYVASSTDSFKAIDYKTAQLPQWRLQTKRNEALHFVGKRLQVEMSGSSPLVRVSLADEGFKGRLVTIISNGQRPRKSIRFLLNRKTARSLDQVCYLLLYVF